MCNKKSSSIERQVRAYPPPKYHTLILAMSKVEGISQSEVVTTAVKEYFDRMPEPDRARLVKLSKHNY